MKYESELIKEIVDSRGHEKSSLHYQSECVESWIEESKGAYPKLCDYESEWLNYINEQPIGEFPYLALTDVTKATVDNVVPYAYKSAILKGNTLVNLVGEKREYLKEGSKPLCGWEFMLPYNLTTGKTYLAVFDVSGTIDTSNAKVYLMDNGFNSESGNTTSTIPSFSLGHNVVKCTATNDKHKVLRIRTVYNEKKFSVSNVMFIEYQEGMENWDIPYFEGMQSVRMPVLTTTGKNLFNKNNIIVDGYIISNGNLVYQKGDNRNATDYIKVEPNCGYSFSGIKNSAINGAKSHQYVGMYDENKTFISVAQIYCLSDNASITTPENTKYIRLSVRNDDINRLQIEKGTATTYEPHQSNILTVNEDVTLVNEDVTLGNEDVTLGNEDVTLLNEDVSLRSNGDICDELNLLTGQLTQRIGKITFNGNENWYESSASSTNHYCIYTRVYGSKNELSYNIVCNSLPSKNILSATIDDEGCLFNKWPDGNKANFVIKIAKSKLSSTDVAGVKAYLKSNPLIVQYELASPIVKTVDLSVVNQDGESMSKIKPIEGTMHLSTSGETIPPLFSGEIPVEAITQNLASFIDLETEE